MLFTEVPLQKRKYWGKSLEVKMGGTVRREKGARIYCLRKEGRRKGDGGVLGSRKEPEGWQRACVTWSISSK